MSEISWIVTLFALVGVVLNIRKDNRCFILWICTNAYWAIYDWFLGAVAQATLFVIYFLLSIWGLWQWRADDAIKEKTL